MTYSDANDTLTAFARLIEDEGSARSDAWNGLKTGVDLGTANIVLSVVDDANRPVAGAFYPSTVVRDGVVVDYVGAVAAVETLKAVVEKRLGLELTQARTAIPPGIHPGNVKAISNVVEAAGFEVTGIIDEPTAAARVLGVRDGAIVDVGGGTTGISVLKDGAVTFVDDEATGGTHMTLVLAGALGLSFEEAEVVKTDPSRGDEVFGIVRPVVEKMAAIVSRFLQGHDAKTIYVVGGACSFPGFEAVFSKYTGLPVVKPAHPLLVTPLGIAMYDARPSVAGEPTP